MSSSTSSLEPEDDEDYNSDEELLPDANLASMSSSTSSSGIEDFLSFWFDDFNSNEELLPDANLASMSVKPMVDLINTDMPLHETETVIPTWIHDVFLSFRGEDTRASFTSHLHASLQNDGINVFIDDRSLQRGFLISASLLQAIEDSQISVVVFSRNYADSRWCLQELEKIMQCHKTRGQVVLPVFYDVYPSEVRHQTGEFGKAFQNHLDRIPEKEQDWLSVLEEEEVKDKYLLNEHLKQIWREALHEAAGLAGFVVGNYRNESEAIKDIVKNVTRLLDKTDLSIPDNPLVGLVEEDLEQMESLTTLVANNTAIKRVPFSVVRSKSIGYISLCGYEGFSRDVFPSIIQSWMSPTNNLSSLFQTSAAMSSLVPFGVANSSSQELSSISKHLPSLRSLWVDCGSELQLSRDAAIILDALYATLSKELESSATTSQVSNMKTSALIQSCSQVHVSGSKNSLKSLLIQIGINCKVTNTLKENILQNMDVNGCGGLLPGDSYPNWLTFNCKGSSVIFEVPQVEGHSLKTMMCIVYCSSPNNTTSDGLKNMLVKNFSKATIQLYKREALGSFVDEEGQRVISSIEPGNKVEVVVVLGNGFIVKKTVVYLVYDVSIGEKMEQCHAPEKNVIVCSDDENESTVRRISPQVDPSDGFKQNRKKKTRLE